MRPVNFSNIAESTEGGFDTLEAGNYICTIVSAKDFPAQHYVRLLINIADGPRKGYFSNDFYANKPWAHNIIMSYKETAQSMLKGRLHVISDCNPGFDAEAAWNGCDPQLFVGKTVGVTFNEEEYEVNYGSIKHNVKPGALIRVSAIKDGTAKPARWKRVNGDWVSLEEGKASEGQVVGSGPSTSAPAYNDDIPFN